MWTISCYHRNKYFYAFIFDVFLFGFLSECTIVVLNFAQTEAVRVLVVLCGNESHHFSVISRIK